MKNKKRRLRKEIGARVRFQERKRERDYFS